MIKAFGFIQTFGEACIYKKVSGSSVAFLILYVDDILLIGNDIEFLDSIKGYLNKSFSMKDLGETAYIFGCVSSSPEKLAGMVNGFWYLSSDRHSNLVGFPLQGCGGASSECSVAGRQSAPTKRALTSRKGRLYAIVLRQ